MAASAGSYREKLHSLLKERGVDKIEDLLDPIVDEQLDGVAGAIALWDDMQKGFPKPGPGLLVSKIRQGGVPGYKRAHERTELDGSFGGVTDELLGSIRAQVLGAAMDREQGLEHFAKLATSRGTTPGALLDSAMGQAWIATPPHPAAYVAWRGRWSFPPEAVAGMEVRYAAYCAGHRRKIKPPDLAALQAPGESDWNFSQRYWDWEDPPGVAEAIAKRAAPVKQPAPPVPEPEPVAVATAEPEDDEW